MKLITNNRQKLMNSEVAVLPMNLLALCWTCYVSVIIMNALNIVTRVGMLHKHVRAGFVNVAKQSGSCVIWTLPRRKVLRSLYMVTSTVIAMIMVNRHPPKTSDSMTTVLRVRLIVTVIGRP